MPAAAAGLQVVGIESASGCFKLANRFFDLQQLCYVLNPETIDEGQR